MKATLFVSYEAGQEVINGLTAGTMVSLQREPTNEADPFAVQAFWDEKAIGYLANSKKTILAGTSPATKISKLMENPKVAGAYAKLIQPHTYGEKNERLRWEVEIFWLPVWDNGEKDKRDPIILKVGGSKVVHTNIITVMDALDSYKGGKLIVNLYDNGATGPVPTVWIASKMDRNDAPAGAVQDPPSDLIAALTTCGTLKVEPIKVIDRGNYQVQVEMDSSNMGDYYAEMEEVIKRGVMQTRDVRERVEYLLAQAVPENIIHGILKSLRPAAAKVVRPSQLYLQTAEDNFLSRALGYHLAGKNIRLVGEKGSGKNTLISSVCWVLNQPLCRVQGNSDMDKIDLLGGQALDDHGTHFELSNFIKTLIEGGDVVLDEINSVKPEIAILIHSLTDDARAIDIPGYGYVEVSPNSRLWATMNEGYIGTGEMNPATVDRFTPIFLKDQMNLRTLLTEMVPNAKKEDIDICVKLYDKILKAVKEAKCSSDAITTRGYIDALRTAEFLNMRQTLMDNIAGRPQDPDDRKAIADFIRAIYPA